MRKNIYYLKGIFIAVLFFHIYCASAQVANTPRQFFSRYLKPESSERVLVFKNESLLTRDQMIAMMKSGGASSLIPSHTSFGLKKEETDKLGMLHTTYNLMINNVEVEKSIARFHEKNGKLKSVSLPELNVPELNTAASVSAVFAETRATEAVTRFTVSDSARNNLSESKLLIIKMDHEYLLTWRTEVYGEDISDRYFAYTDAHTGEIVKKVSRKISCAGSQSLPTLYNGNQIINYDIYPFNSSLHELLDNCRPTDCGEMPTTNIETLWTDGVSFYLYAKNTTDPWPINTHYQTGYSIHWACGRAYDYFRCIQGRDGFDNAGMDIFGVAHAVYDNAFWNGAYLGFGDPYPLSSPFSGPLVSLDVVAHEYTHAVTQFTGNMTYELEAGALNEAWSDIFGTVVEFYTEGAGANFEIGEDITFAGSLRSMSNPNLRGQPDTYGGTYWVNTVGCTPTGGISGNDYCGVHTNSGVANFWFYLLTNGGSGTNDIGNPYTVSSIGMDDAADIAYRALANYFTPTIDFDQARTYTILAAEDLFGICSNQAIQAAKAWHAVGVGNDVLYIRDVCGTFGSGTNQTYRAVNTIRSGSTYCSGIPVAINSGANVSFISGEEILLMPDFIADAGSNFLGEISACNPGSGISQFKKSDVNFIGAGNSYTPGSNIIDKQELDVYPNPGTGLFKLTAPINGNLTILNSTGESLYHKAVSANQEIVFDLSGKSKGIYFVRISNDDEIKIEKILLE